MINLREKQDADLVDHQVDLILEKELPNMGEPANCESSVWMWYPLGEHLGVDMGRSAGVVSREDGWIETLAVNLKKGAPEEHTSKLRNAIFVRRPRSS